MSVDYTQKCILGLEFDIEKLKVIDKKALYETQNRYDTKTGEIIKTENVKIKDEEYHYEFMGESYQDLYSISYEYEDISVIVDGNSLFFGISLGETYDYGGATLIEDSISIPILLENVEKLVKILPEALHTQIEIYFIGMVG
jgi:hypothetical protein